MKVAVVGGGISGMSAAWELREHADVLIFESERLGGKIQTELFAGCPVDCGPDAFISRSPAAVDLCAEIGLTDLVAPEAVKPLITWERRLHSLPDGTVLGAPSRLGPLVRSTLISPVGVARAAADLLLPRSSYSGDVSVRRLVADRFGPQIVDRLVDPLVGTIYAGSCDELSARATVPQLLERSVRSRSMLRGLRRASPATGEPMFIAPRAGMYELVQLLSSRLDAAGVKHRNAGVMSVVHRERGIEVDGERFDGAILATPASEAAKMLGGQAPSELSQIQASTVAVVTLGYQDLTPPDGISGILVPRGQGMLTTACSFGSSKWPHWASGSRSVLRVSVGRAGEDLISGMDDDMVVERVAGEVVDLLGTAAQPDLWRVNRWPRALPQYVVGHLDRVSRTEAELRRKIPAVRLCGASYHGIGIPACIASGRQAARSLVCSRWPR